MWVDGDPDLLEQALLNLVRNAVAHTGVGGRVEIACAPRGLRRARLGDRRRSRHPAGRPRAVFDRFYRAQGTRRDDATGGAGLGLAIVSRLVELHGGSVSAENVTPHGARVTIALPRIGSPA